MRKRSFFAAASLALLVAFAVLSGTALAVVRLDWNQWGHDASRTSRSAARGPVWPRLVPGWPVGCGPCVAGPVIAEIDVPGEAAPRRAVFTGSNFVRTIYGFGADGRTLPGDWPAVLGPASWGGTLGFPAVARIGLKTRVFAASQGDSGLPWGTMYAVEADGQPLFGRWPWTSPGLQMHAYPTLTEEAVTESFARKATVYFAYATLRRSSFLHAMSLDGLPRRGWPVRTGSTSLLMGPAVAPDGSAYIVSRRHGKGGPYIAVEAFSARGKRKEGWPVRLGGSEASARLSGPAIGRDGTVYVGIETQLPYFDGPSRYYAIDSDGRVRAGWPVTLGGSVIGTPAIAPDGTTYVSVQRVLDDGRRVASLYAFSGRGRVKPGWPLRFETEGGHSGDNAISGVALDADDNVYFASGNVLYGYSPRARLLPGWPLKVEGVARLGLPALANDGTLYFLGIAVSGRLLYAVESGSRPRAGRARERKRRSGTKIRKRGQSGRDSSGRDSSERDSAPGPSSPGRSRPRRPRGVLDLLLPPNQDRASDGTG